jgi:hypothetical protein
MTTTLKTILIVAVAVLTVLSISYLVYRNVHKRWRCTEGSCEQDIDGDYASKSACLDACKKKQAMMQTMTQAPESDEDAWACTSNYECIPSSKGKFVSKDACESTCKQPTTYYYPRYYYPQSLYYPRRPYYWDYGRYRHRKKRHKKGRGDKN